MNCKSFTSIKRVMKFQFLAFLPSTLALTIGEFSEKYAPSALSTLNPQTKFSKFGSDCGNAANSLATKLDMNCRVQPLSSNPYNVSHPLFYTTEFEHLLGAMW